MIDNDNNVDLLWHLAGEAHGRSSSLKSFVPFVGLSDIDDQWHGLSDMNDQIEWHGDIMMSDIWEHLWLGLIYMGHCHCHLCEMGWIILFLFIKSVIIIICGSLDHWHEWHGKGGQLHCHYHLWELDHIDKTVTWSWDVSSSSVVIIVRKLSFIESKAHFKDRLHICISIRSHHWRNFAKIT